MVIYQEQLKAVKKYVTKYYQHHSNDALYYHNLQHTEFVVNAVQQIGNHYKLSEEDFFIVNTAAWFHDIGYCEEKNGKAHELLGANMATAYLLNANIDAAIAEKIANCIKATQLPQKASSLIEEIVCDADLFHLGSDNFVEVNKLLRKEFKAARDLHDSKNDWYEDSISFLQKHAYYTDYANLLLADKQAKNIALLQKKLMKEIEKGGTQIAENTEKQIAENTEKQMAKPIKAVNKPERGVETVFRVTSSNNQQLSSQADNKSSIMITVNAIIISVLLSVLLGKVAENPNLLIPTLLLLITNVGTIIFAILATRPSLPNGILHKEDIASKQVNLLFFGNFYKTPLDVYNEGMLQLLEDKDFLYGSLIRDVHSQGLVLGKKYKLLRIAYNFFMFGLIFSIIAFVIAFIYTGTK